MRGTTNAFKVGAQVIHETIVHTHSGGELDLSPYSSRLEKILAIAQNGGLIRFTVKRKLPSQTSASYYYTVAPTVLNNIGVIGVVSSSGVTYTQIYKNSNGKWVLYTSGGTNQAAGEYTFDFWYLSEIVEA